jgi:hypothetical protein
MITLVTPSTWRDLQEDVARGGQADPGSACRHAISADALPGAVLAVVTAEMLRGTQGDFLVVPVTGEDSRASVREGDHPDRLKKLHEAAVIL